MGVHSMAFTAARVGISMEKTNKQIYLLPDIFAPCKYQYVIDTVIINREIYQCEQSTECNALNVLIVIDLTAFPNMSVEP